ncbi:MAG: GatB/YqeY domain-containing protein [Anaeromyxobacteraceae bacterium]
MSFKEQLDQELKAAMREKDALKLSVIRMLKSAVKYREIELMKPLDDAGVLAAISTEIKRRKDSVEQYRAGHRDDLAEKEEAELRILQGWLPAQMGAEELKALVEAAVQKCGAQGPKDMGAVMKLVVPETQGKADGKVVSEMVKARLSGK